MDLDNDISKEALNASKQDYKPTIMKQRILQASSGAYADEAKKSITKCALFY